MATTGPTKWGIISCGRISHDWALGVSTLSPKEHEIVGVAAKNLSHAQNFAQIHHIPKVHATYEKLLQDSDIEIVYIGTINTEHLAIVKLALNNGKHVLCEKPLGMNLREAQEMVDYARTKKRFLMEAIWSRFFPAYQKLREEIENGSIGQVLQVTANMGYVPPPGEWRLGSKLGGGVTLDLGTYVIQLTTMIFKGLKPLKISAAGHVNDRGADVTASVSIIFPGGRTATLLAQNQVTTSGDAVITGTNGSLKLPFPMWCPTKLEAPNQTFEFPLPQIDKKTNYLHSVGLSYQCHEIRRCLQEGLLESRDMSWDDTLLIAEIRDEILKQIGVSYSQHN